MKAFHLREIPELSNRDRQNITQCIHEQKLSEKAFIEESTQLEVGKLVSANYIVSITILKKKNTYAIDCRINNAETGETVGKAFGNPNCSAVYLENGDLINDMGYALLLGLGVKEKDLAGLKTNKSAEQAQSVSDNTNLAKGVTAEREGKDISQVTAYYNKISSDSDMSGEALWRLGEKYYEGNEVEKDYEKVFYFFTKSAEQGNQEGQFRLGFCYEFGLGTMKDFEKAFYWYTKSAEQGNSFAQCKLGMFYFNGYGTKKDLKKAFHWSSKSAEQGNSFGQTLLGMFYYSGSGTTQDLNYE